MVNSNAKHIQLSILNLCVCLVPVIPPPNEHPLTPLFMPTKYADLVTLPSAHGINLMLKKVKGVKPLNLELSWT